MKSQLTLILDTLKDGRKEYVVGWMDGHKAEDVVSLNDPANASGWMAPGLNDFPNAVVVTTLQERDGELQVWGMVRGPKPWESDREKKQVALLVKFPDGAVVIRWPSKCVGTTACFNRLADALLVHGHETEFHAEI